MYLGPVSYQLFLGQNQILKLHQQQRMGIDIFSRVMSEQEETIQNENVNKMQLFSKLGPKYVTTHLKYIARTVYHEVHRIFVTTNQQKNTYRWSQPLNSGQLRRG